MIETFAAMKSRIELICIKLEKDAMHLPPQEDPRRIEELRRILDRIVSEFNVYDYAFSYAAQRFASNHVKSCVVQLKEIYHEGCAAPFYNADSNTPGNVRLRGFVAFFLLVTYYIHFKQPDEIASLLEDHEYDCNTAFRDMPLYFDLISRYDKRNTDGSGTNWALLQERLALNKLEQLSCQNVAVNCSFASTVSMMLQRKERVSNADAEWAIALIEDAITYNPDYAKYYYIRAKLNYYLTAAKQTGNQRLETLYLAQEDCQLAIIRENNLREDYWIRVEDYRQLLEQIEDQIILLETELEAKDRSDPNLNLEQLETLRQEILDSPDEAALSHYPPANTFGGQYVFICYSRSDYQRVYCDLLEMAVRRIPFLYDRRTVLPGYNWDEAVEERILDSQCAGVIFYLGDSSVFSAALDKEIKVVQQKAKKMNVQPNELLFSVNLTQGNEPPSMMLINAIRNTSLSTLQKAHLGSERIVRFLSTFTDAGDFIRRGENAAEFSHMDHLEAALRNKFHIRSRKE